MRYITKIINLLKKQYAFDFHTSSSPYKILISCLLSLRTRDEVSFPASGRLFRLAKTPKQMLRLNLKKIQKIIYPVCFYKTKAKRIKEISETIIKKYNCKVPDTIEALLELKGVGRKTANIVVTYGFNKAGIAVDTHVHRISNRIGYVKTKTPNDTEFVLRKKLPKKYWKIFNELLVKHGQTICHPVSPKCSICSIKKYCKRIGVKISR